MNKNENKKTCLCDMSIEEQDDFWQDLLHTREGRVRLLKQGMTQKQIEKMYLDYNAIEVINIPILNELYQLKI